MHSFCSNVPFKRLFRLFTIDQVTILYHIDSNPTAWSNTIYPCLQQEDSKWSPLATELVTSDHFLPSPQINVHKNNCE